MTTVSIPFTPEDGHSSISSTPATRRSLALAAASSLWSNSHELFTEEFLTESLDESPDELSQLLDQVESFTLSSNFGAEDLGKFRSLLLEAAQSVFLRWKVLHQLRTMALTDELTGLYNRRGFLLLGTHNVSLALRMGQPLLLFFADVDGLKHINDSCGHVQGDALLVACGEVLKMTFRESDIIARIGGDEFAILAQGNSNESRDVVLSRLQSSVARVNRDVLKPYQLSLSVGAAGFDPSNPVALSELLSIADREMMFAKLTRSYRDFSGFQAPRSGGNGNGHS